MSLAGEDYFDDDLDDFIADMEVPETATKAKSKPASSTKAKSSPVPSRPALKQSGSGSGGISHIKTQAETNRAVSFSQATSWNSMLTQYLQSMPKTRKCPMSRCSASSLIRRM